MEKPHYGRTGLLDSRLSGLPVTQPRLLATNATTNTTTSRALKWYPSLLTVPQQLLDALRQEDDEGSDHISAQHSRHVFSADPTLVVYLRIATIAEVLLRCWGEEQQPQHAAPTRAQAAQLYASVFAWSHTKVGAAAALASSSGAAAAGEKDGGRHGTFFVPAYKLLVMKDDHRVTEYANITWRSVWLLGKEPVVNDVPLEHPSCSAQHASLEMRFVPTDESPLLKLVAAAAATQSDTVQGGAVGRLFPLRPAAVSALCDGLWALLGEQLEEAGGDATAVWAVELQLTDLGSTNRTKLNGEPVPALEATTLIDSDVLEFGCSTRKYVVMRST